ncbi:GNAT family N-acetyltransferase [Streptomyces bauhiniae]|uniref:GNAT family N-acetyltransferase n=1 Tax=Streptomyces bauhiniae TaxID=2340725 RepID=UPI0035E3AADC
MRSSGWCLTDDVEDFLVRAGGFLRARPAEHVMQLTWAERVRVRGVGAFGRAPVFGVLEEDGEVSGTFYHLPPRALGLSPLTPAQADSLAAHLAGTGLSPASVGADHDTAAAFAEAWHRRTGVAAKLRDVRVRLYRLGTLTPPEPSPEGRARVLGEGDLGQAVFWCGEFARAVGEDVTIDAVSIAGMNPLIGGQIQVDIVYTPAHLRGHGYAAAVSAEVSRAALAAGAQEVVLFADRSNPTSNALYQRLGYRPLSDWSGYDFASVE